MTNLSLCPEPRRLERFAVGAVSEADSGELELHLEACPICRRILASLTPQDELLDALRLSKATELGAGTGRESSPIASERDDDWFANLLIPHFQRLPHHDPNAGDDTVEPAAFDSSLPLGETPRGSEREAPSRIGKYVVERPLGAGGMGTVLRAFDPDLQRSVAIKVIKPNSMASPEMAELFLREARSAAVVEHDHIVTIHAVEMYRESPCIVMPLLRGQTLQQLLDARPGPLPVAEVVRISRETAEGLVAAHSHGLVHCDIKPANLWLEEPRGRVKILDFGLAVARECASRDDQIVAGTPGYMAPEQVGGLGRDQRTDIFGLGCVAYRMATGVMPFQGTPALRALWTVIGKPSPILEFNPRVPSSFADLVTRMIARSPEARPATMAEVVEVLKRFEQQQALRQRNVTRRRWLVSLMSVAAVTGTGVALWAHLQGDQARPRSNVTLEGDSPPVEIVLRSDGHEHPVTLGPATSRELPRGDYYARLVKPVPGRQLVPDRFAVTESKEQRIRLAIVGELARDATHTEPVTCLSLLPQTGPTTILSAGLDRVLVRWRPGVQPAIATAELPHSVRCLAVSPDGSEVITAGGNKFPPVELELRRWSTSSLAPIGEPLVGHSRLVTSVAYSPDQTFLASASVEGCFLWNLKSGERETLETPDGQVTMSLRFSSDGRRLLAGCDGGMLVAWETATGRVLMSRVAGSTAVRCVDHFSGGFVSGGDDGVLRVWRDEELVARELNTAGHAIGSLAVSSDGKGLLSGMEDGVVRVWHLPSGRMLHALQGHREAVRGVSFVPGDRQAVSCGDDGTVRLWQLPFWD